ncbi:MAG: ATP-binding cassette domain-containing protein [Candidatus Dormibacteraeota bacterium]|nr:ATP-binding cassette domain-containing protein [Candidatus Dormibacteraeota bacterium]
MPDRPPPLLDLRCVTVVRGETPVLQDFSLLVEEGEHMAILGPNGCGKSTLIKTITKELYPLPREGSRVQILGRERWDVFQLRRLLGIVTGDLQALSNQRIRGRDVVLSGFFSSIGIWPNHEVTEEMRERARRAMERLGVDHLADRFVIHTSSGEARRLLIARALVHDPTALLLDEPSTSLDLAAQRELTEAMRSLAREGVGLLLVTHHLADVIPEIERVLLMKQGRVVADGPKEELLTAARLEEIFERPVDLARRDGYYHAW